MSQTVRRIEVAAGLLFHKNKLLITQRRAGDHLGGFWEFPGGKREGDETFEFCLIRELREELGIEVNVLELYDRVAHDYPDKLVDLRFYRCALVQGEPKPLACAAVAWVTTCELEKYNFPAADAQLLAKLKRDPGLWE